MWTLSAVLSRAASQSYLTHCFFPTVPPVMFVLGVCIVIIVAVTCCKPVKKSPIEEAKPVGLDVATHSPPTYSGD